MTHGQKRDRAARTLRRALQITAVAAALAAGAGTASAAEQGIKNDSITLGMLTSQTGPIAVFGLAYERSARIVFDEVNAKGGIHGRKIDLQVEDDRSDTGSGAAAVNKLLDRTGAFLIFGGIYTPVVMSVMPLITDSKRMFWSPASSSPGMTKPLNPLVFQADLTTDDQAVPAAKFIASMKVRKIAVIAQNGEFGKVVHDSLIEELKPYNLSVSQELSIEPDAVNAVVQVAQIKSSGAEVIVLGASPPKLTALIIRELYKQGVKAPLIAFNAGSSPALFDLVTGEAPIEYYAVSTLGCVLGDPCTQEFMAAWKAKYPNETPTPQAAQGYAATKLFVAGLEAAGRDLTTAGLAKTFETMPALKRPEVPYPYKYSATNHRAIRQGFLEGFKNGKRYFFGDQYKPQ